MPRSPDLNFYPFGPAPSDTFAPTPPVCQRRGVFSHRCTTVVIDELILTTPLHSSNGPVFGALADARQRLADLAAAVRR